MSVTYEDLRKRFLIFEKRSDRVSAHVHNHFELALVTAGTMELGVGQEMFHMEKGDFAVIFPDLIHHYRVHEKGRRRSVYVLADPNFAGADFPHYERECPVNPVIKAEHVHPDILYAVRQMLKEREAEGVDDVRHAFVQLILARAMPEFEMIDKSAFGSPDLVYRTVEYMARHYNEDISLTSVAHELGSSPYTLSRIFSQTLHTNFNQYLNRLRLDHAVYLLLYSDAAITEICFLCGFESQRTFNRAFREYLHMTPREYRKLRASGDPDEERVRQLKSEPETRGEGNG